MEIEKEPAFCYIAISPDPTGWSGLCVPDGGRLPTTDGNYFTPPSGECYYIKIGDQKWGCVRDEGYKTPNPSCELPCLILHTQTHSYLYLVYWCNISVKSFVRNDGDPRVGTKLASQVLRNFVHVGHGREWYYSFGNRDGLVAMIDWFRRKLEGGLVKYDTEDEAVAELGKFIKTQA